jgi:hypothetical protein
LSARQTLRRPRSPRRRPCCSTAETLPERRFARASVALKKQQRQHYAASPFNSLSARTRQTLSRSATASAPS